MKTRLMACIQGGQFAPERKRHAAGIMQHSKVSGVVVGGLGTGESPELRLELINASLSEVPQGLPRVLAAGAGQISIIFWIDLPTRHVIAGPEMCWNSAHTYIKYI